jgi:hypothetical protein
MNDNLEASKGKSWLKIGCLGLVGLFVLLALIVAFAPEPTPEQIAEREAEEAAEEAAAAKQSQAEAQAKIDSAVPVSSRELASAYEANEVRAQQQYGGKPLLVTGRVKGVTLDFSDDPVVQMEGSNEFLDVQADLNDKAAAAALDKGQEISLLCKKVTEVIRP